LITFQSSATVSQNITHAIENFRHKVNGMNARGDTALWDALALANDQLSEYAKKFPNAKKRIICISDGDDTKSKQRSSDVSWSLFVSAFRLRQSIYADFSLAKQGRR
jgi:Mg-chelatase subunit ChlD